MKYAKEPLARGLVATNLVGLTGNNATGTISVLRQDLGTPEGFHTFTLQRPTISVRHYPAVFRQTLKKKLPLESASKRVKKLFYQSCIQASLYHFAQTIPLPIKVPDGLSYKQRASYQLGILRSRGYDFVHSHLSISSSFADILVEEAALYLESTGKLKQFEESARRRGGGDTERTESSSGEKSKRIRNPWTEEEENKLVQNVKDQIPFLVQAMEPGSRSRKALSDHYELMRRKAEDKDKLPEPKRINRVLREKRQPTIKQ